MEKWKDKQEFKERVREFAAKMNATINHLVIRPMKNKWASCSTDGNLNFNDELLEMDREIGDYVIVHELLHFKVPNHGEALEEFDAGVSGGMGGDSRENDEKLISHLNN